MSHLNSQPRPSLEAQSGDDAERLLEELGIELIPFVGDALQLNINPGGARGERPSHAMDTRVSATIRSSLSRGRSYPRAKQDTSCSSRAAQRPSLFFC